MNIASTSVNFTGKKEIVYGLRKAAQEAKTIEINRSYAFGPRPIRRDYEINEAKGALNAYADMVTKDGEFNTAIKEIAEDKKFTKELGETLKPKDVQYGKINPLGEFVQSLSESFKKNVSKTLNDDVKAFFKSIKL